MADPFAGEITMFAGDFPPRGWAFCDGQLIAVSQNDALFSLLGTIYGGDGETTFGLPDMRGRIPIHQGTGPGLSPRRLGSRAGTENETLTVNQLPSHNHPINGTPLSADTKNPENALPAALATENIYRDSGNAATTRIESMAESGGSNRSHTNLMPTLCVNFIIALYGTYPSRT